MNFITGFIDIRYHIFYENLVPSHDKNARKIIEDRCWLYEYQNDPIHNISPSDFLVFRKGFAQIGTSGRMLILVSKELYKNDTNHSKIWKAIFKTLKQEYIHSIIHYKLYLIK